MTRDNPNHGRVIQVNDRVVGHIGRKPEPRLRSVKPRKIGDYLPTAATGGVPAAYLEVAKSYANPLLMGPPICDELVAVLDALFDRLYGLHEGQP